MSFPDPWQKIVGMVAYCALNNFFFVEKIEIEKENQLNVDWFQLKSFL